MVVLIAFIPQISPVLPELWEILNIRIYIHKEFELAKAIVVDKD
ncbi:MAG: hypothetical protein ACLTLQ_03425 [[Clostridium] scindens]